MRRAALRRTLVVVASGMLVAAACSSSKAGVTTARPTIATAVQSTTTTDPYAVPPVIDVAYVNRVLAGLDAAVGDVVRFVVATRLLPPDIIVRIKPFYDDHGLARQLEIFHQDDANHYAAYRDPPGNQVTAVVELITAIPTCLFAHVTRDYSAVVEHSKPELADQWVGLVRLDPTRDPDHRNHTLWSYIYDGFEIDHRKPKNPCDN